MPTNLEGKYDVMVVSDKWTEKQVARHVANLATRSLYNDKTFALFNIQDVIDKVTQWRRKMPRITPFYAVKCNYNLVLIEVLAALGVCFDCASKHELELILSAGVEPDRIIYAHTAKPRSHLLYARQNGIDLMTFDSDMELLKIKQFHQNSKLLVRIKCDGKLVVNKLGNKFGCDPYDEAPIFLRIAKDLNLQVVGVSFHVGSLCHENLAYRRGIEMARHLFGIGWTLGHHMQILDIGGGFPGDLDTSITELADIVNNALEDYFPISEEVEVIAEPGRYFVASAFTLATCVHSVRRPLSYIQDNAGSNRDEDQNSPESVDTPAVGERNEENPGLNGNSENGESNSKNDDNGDVTNGNGNNINGNGAVDANNGDNGDLIDSANNMNDEAEDNVPSNGDNEDTNQEDENGLNLNDNELIDPSEGTIKYFLDNGIYSSFAGVKVNRLIINPEPLEPVEGKNILSSLWGPTCDGIDCIIPRILLPPLPVPSWLLFNSFGAYTTTTATNFNGFGIPVDRAYATKSTWEVLNKLPHIINRNRLHAIFVSREFPQPYAIGRPMLPNMHINQLLPLFSSNSNAESNRSSPSSSNSSPRIAVSALSSALRTASISHSSETFPSPTSILKPFPRKKVSFNKDIFKKSVRFLLETTNSAPKHEVYTIHNDKKSPLMNKIKPFIPPAHYTPPGMPAYSSDNIESLAEFLKANFPQQPSTSTHNVSPATPTTSYSADLASQLSEISESGNDADPENHHSDTGDSPSK